MADKPKPTYQLQVCGVCKQQKKRVIAVAGKDGTTLVGRCMLCDTLPCPKCQGRTIDPKDTNCQHCKRKIGLMDR